MGKQMLISSAVVQIGLSDALPPEQGDGKRCPFFALKRVCASKYNLATLQAKKIIWGISEEHFSYSISSLVQTANMIFAQEKFAYEAKEETA